MAVTFQGPPDTADHRVAQAHRVFKPADVKVIVQQHVDDAAILHATRSALLSSPHVALEHLRRFDARLLAHLDALCIAGESAWPLIEAQLESAETSVVFVVASRAIQDRQWDRIDRLVALAQAEETAQRGLRAALGWLEPDALRGIVVELLRSSDPLRRCVGVASSAMHRTDPGVLTARRLEDPEAVVRARACRAVGELGMREASSSLAALLEDDDVACQFWAAWSSVLIGDRERALERLLSSALPGTCFAWRSFQLALLSCSIPRAHEFLRHLAQDTSNVRSLIRGAGLVGDPTYIPWLIAQMSNDKLARLAGESFSMITGLDLAALDLERKPPEDFESGPNDDPEDPNVDMDEDDGLPWPDQARIERWWSAHGQRFTQGERHFMGEAPSRAHCIRVLKEGFQRQRIAAAFHLCLLQPGTPLFEWRAPAWRQQRELDRFGD